MLPHPLILVGILEDHYPYAKALERMLHLSPDLSITGVWHDGETALEEIRRQSPDIVLMDINLPGISGIDCIRRLSVVSPHVQVLVLTQCEDDENVFEALRAGAAGYLLKGEESEVLIRSIREVWAGESPISRQISRKLVRYFNRLPVPGSNGGSSLTRREDEILSLLAEGKIYKEVSVRLGIAMETTKKHVRNIYTKLHVQNKTEAINKWRHSRYDMA
jgi:NarL family two-component system response regulator LiaR